MGSDIAARRQEYLEGVIARFEGLSMAPLDGRAWSLNHARLALGRDVGEANRYFASAQLTRDRDFMGIGLLKTLLDFGGTPKLGSEARRHLESAFVAWPVEEVNTVARWPALNTENHDLMHLTIGLFAERLRGNPVDERVRQLCRSLAWRFERGWLEWNSPRYQLHYLNPLMVLADHAPADRLREGAQALVNVQLAERALLSVNGYLAGPFFRGWDRHRLEGPDGRPVQRGACAYFDNNRYDAYLATMWIVFGLAEPCYDYTRTPELEPAGEGYGCGGDARLNQDEGMAVAASDFVPHPIVGALAAEAAARPCLVYRGTRPSGWPPHPLWGDNPPLAQLYYHNTPHVSMGSLQSCGWSHQTRYCSIMFADEPSMNLRIDRVLPGVQWDRWRQERRGELAQHRGWLLGRGELVEDGAVRPVRTGTVNLYRVGKGMIAHTALDSEYHVLQAGDLDQFASEDEFLARVTPPTRKGHVVEGETAEGDRVAVDVRDMSISVNGTRRERWDDMLHDSEPMASVYGSGAIHIRTAEGELTLDHSALIEELARA